MRGVPLWGESRVVKRRGGRGSGGRVTLELGRAQYPVMPTRLVRVMARLVPTCPDIHPLEMTSPIRTPDEMVAFVQVCYITITHRPFAFSEPHLLFLSWQERLPKGLCNFAQESTFIESSSRSDVRMIFHSYGSGSGFEVDDGTSLVLTFRGLQAESAGHGQLH